MTISKKDIPVLLGVAGLLLAVLVYYFLYMPYQDKVSALQSANETLNQQLTDLSEKTANKAHYETEITRMQGEINKVYAMFPPALETEDGIAEAITLEQMAPMEIASIDFQPAAAVYTLGGGDTTAAAPAASSDSDTESSTEAASGDTSTEQDIEAAQNGQTTTYAEGTVPAIQFSSGVLPAGYQGDYGPITLNDNAVTYTFVTSYDGVKRLCDFVTANQNKEAIQTITLGYDANTGLLAGNAVLNEYSLTGTGKTYSYPALPSVEIGTANIFGTATITGGTGSVSGNAAAKKSSASGNTAAKKGASESSNKAD